MNIIEKVVGIPPLSDVMSHRLVLCLFCMLTFFILIYFWDKAHSDSAKKEKGHTGMFYLSFVFLLYAILGMVSVYDPGKAFYLIVSAWISVFYLLSLPLFAMADQNPDKLVRHPLWRPSIVLTGLGWTVFILIERSYGLALNIDVIQSSVAFLVFALYISRTYLKQGLNLLAFITVFLFLLFITLQCFSPEFFGKGKFVHINSTILTPALFIAIISVAYTFKWMNDQLFYQISRIYSSTGEQDNRENEKDSKEWFALIAKDDLEQVIESLLTIKKRKNEKLDIILNAAQRNNRNNTSYLKGVINYEDYMLFRARIAQTLYVIIN